MGYLLHDFPLETTARRAYRHHLASQILNSSLRMPAAP
jgi:hypothetical protein